MRRSYLLLMFIAAVALVAFFLVAPNGMKPPEEGSTPQARPEN